MLVWHDSNRSSVTLSPSLWRGACTWYRRWDPIYTPNPNPLPSPTNTPPSLSAGLFACSNDSDGKDELVYVGEGRDRACSMCRPCTHIACRNYIVELFMTLSDFDIIVRPNFRSKRDLELVAGEYRGCPSAFTSSTTFPIWHHVRIETQWIQMVHSLYTSSHSP